MKKISYFLIAVSAFVFILLGVEVFGSLNTTRIIVYSVIIFITLLSSLIISVASKLKK